MQLTAPEAVAFARDLLSEAGALLSIGGEA